jgi:tetratricopeptide (TPR) repeat protein
LKNNLCLFAFICILASCNHDKKIIVESAYVDSLINNYTEPAVTTNAADIKFWRSRIDTANHGFTNELRYSSALAARFALKGDIQDLKSSDSILKVVAQTFNYKEAAPYTSLVPRSISQHKFNEADTFLTKAKQIGIKAYEDRAYSFDVNFELGRYPLAIENLDKVRDSKDYGYEFRLSKLEHHKGNLDSATHAMLNAASLAGNNPVLIAAALSNAADLYVHAGQLEDAYKLYKKSVASYSSDLHSIMGIGWIALVHDKNDSVAKKIFLFVSTKTKAPEPILKLSQTAELNNDSASMKKYAQQFVDMTSNPLYGTMYNKYLVELYTGILNNPAKAEAIARNEIANRRTPQTYAWDVWCLYFDNKKDEAYKVYEEHVSGQPLEGIELYWMGKFMKGLGKGYNAHEFFKAADKNKYDLSPSMMRDLDENLKE